MFRRAIPAQFSNLGPDEVLVKISTDILARDGHVLVPEGCQLGNYRANPIVLWGHDPDLPIGNSENVAISGHAITARVRFAPSGISPKADEVRGLVKAGVVRTVSVGFDPIRGTPIDPKNPRGGQRFTEWELLELSFCSVPVDTGAVVTARSKHSGERGRNPTSSPALQAAHDLAEQCRATIATVLDGPGEDLDGDADDFARRQRHLALLALQQPPECAAFEKRQRDLAELILQQPPECAAFERRRRDLARLKR